MNSIETAIFCCKTNHNRNLNSRIYYEESPKKELSTHRPRQQEESTDDYEEIDLSQNN